MSFFKNLHDILIDTLIIRVNLNSIYAVSWYYKGAHKIVQQVIEIYWLFLLASISSLHIVYQILINVLECIDYYEYLEPSNIT